MDEKTNRQPNELINSAKSILIAVRRNPLMDTLASALALYMALKKSGKQVYIITPRPVTVEYGSIIGVDEVKTEIGARNLVLSWDYEEGAVEKVNYHVKEGKFYFVIQPRTGQKPFPSEMVKFSYSGADADLVITVGTQTLDQLEKIYNQEKDFLSTATIINIDKDRNNGNYGVVNVVDTHASSIAELVVDFIRDLELPVDADIATNLLTGLIEATDNFQKPTVNARTFEAAAACLQAGARRIARVTGYRPQVQRPEVKLKPEDKQSLSSRKLEDKHSLHSDESKHSLHSAHELAESKEQGQEISLSDKEVVEPSPDWLRPKIYKGSSEV